MFQSRVGRIDAIAPGPADDQVDGVSYRIAPYCIVSPGSPVDDAMPVVYLARLDELVCGGKQGKEEKQEIDGEGL
jgi:hypothetical protein